MQKIPLTSIESACECPFYVRVGGQSSCFMKKFMSADQAMEVTEGGDYYNADYWAEDCLGEYDNCVILPLLYEEYLDEEEEEEPPSSAETVMLATANVDDFDPFGEDDDDAEAIQPLPALSAPIPERDFSSSAPKSTILPKVKIYRVDPDKNQSPYIVKCDVLVSPTNQELIIDDPLLSRLTRGVVQAECHKISRPITMGHVYTTSGEGTSAHRIYHAVLQGVSRLVKEGDIPVAVRMSLSLADANGAKAVVFMPFDCGMMDLDIAAAAQLGAIATYLKTTPPQNISHIYIVMEDEETESVFNEYYRRIFKK